MDRVEKEILSACLLSSENVAVAVERGVEGRWFSSHGDIFDALVQMEKEWTERDSLVVLDHILKKYKCFEIAEEIPEWAFDQEEVNSAIDVLASLYARRKLLEELSLAHSRLAEGDDPFEVAGSLVDHSEGVECLLDKGGDTLDSKVDEAFEVDTKVAEGGRLGLPFPWISLQARTFGIPDRSVVPLAGRDGKGKSFLATFLTHFWINQGIPILYFAFEDGEKRFLSKLAAIHGGYDMFTIKRDYVPPDFLPNHRLNMDTVKKMPVHVEEIPCTVERVYQIIAKHKRKLGIEGVVIDGIKDVTRSKGDGEVAKDNHITSTLVRASKKFDVTIIPISHLHDIDDDRWISKRNIRGSKRQSQDGRMVMLYQDWIPDKMRADFGAYDNEVVLDIPKASYGDSGFVMLRPQMHVGKFEEVKKEI